MIAPTRYECLSAPLNKEGEANAWWLDRNSAPHFYWSGDASVENKYVFQMHLNSREKGITTLRIYQY
jgi:hypothetical protein